MVKLPIRNTKNVNQLEEQNAPLFFNIYFHFKQHISTTFEPSKRNAMKLLTFTLLGIIVLSSCTGGNDEKKIISVEKKVVYKPTAKVNADRKLAVEVSGMTCEHACGGSIRMALKETNAVDRVSFDFETDRKINTAFITFDKSKISADEIVAIIEKINDKQFTTGKVSSEAVETKITDSAAASNSTSSSEVKPKIEVSTTSNFEMPNLFELFSKIIS